MGMRNSRARDAKLDEADRLLFIRNSKNIGWFFPCMHCYRITADETTYLLIMRKDVDQITFSVCHRCRPTSTPAKLVVHSRIQYTEHLNVCLATPRRKGHHLRVPLTFADVGQTSSNKNDQQDLGNMQNGHPVDVHCAVDFKDHRVDNQRESGQRESIE